MDLVVVVMRNGNLEVLLEQMELRLQFNSKKEKSASITTFHNTGSGSGYYHISGNADYTNGSIIGGDRKFTLTCPSTGNQNEYLFSWTADSEL